MYMLLVMMLGGTTVPDASMPPGDRAPVVRTAADDRAGHPPAMPGLRTLCPAVPDVAFATGEPAGLKIGQTLTPALRARLGRDVTKVRILEGMAMATMDWVPGRLTIVLDKDGRIRRLTCG